ncbi:unnamed protein product [Chrysodeixis includens]|uniref:Choline/ethanolamine transporter FLVCR1 n=1 Tax=Chrysodeixis includens TaxID=689277 RepID=A0A9P0BS05_CHRIL|nr:unnamed protein product [Chrysodeixis includens]
MLPKDILLKNKQNMPPNPKTIDVSVSVIELSSEKRGSITKLPSKKAETEYQVYPNRWLVLFIFVFYSASNSLQWTQYTIIQDAIVKYYDVTSNQVYWTSMIYMLTFIPLIFPACWLLDKTNIRVCVIIGAFGTGLGTWLKVFSVPQDMFWLGFAGQTVAAVSQVFVLNIPPRLAAVWFGPNQVSSACSIGVFGNMMGVAMGFVLPPMLVRASGTTEEIASDLQLMFNIYAAYSSVLFVFILLFLKASPPTPPSAAEDFGSALDSNFLLSLKTLMTNRNFILLLLSYGINVGVFLAISTLLNEVILTHYPDAHLDAGRIGLVFVVSGMVGSVVCGVILDRTHRFKETTMAVYVATIAGMLVFTFTLDCGYIGIVYLSSILLGFFMTAYLAIGYEMASEVTYPEPEGTTSGILNAVVQLFGIIITLVYERVLGAADDRAANLTAVGMLCAGAAVSAAISSDLRRQNAQNKNKESLD